MELIDRALSRVEVGDCWLWLGYRDEDGYGRIKVDGHSRGVHRIVYDELVGPVAEGLTLDHLCRVRHCVNPDHLEPVTKRVNDLRGYGAPAQAARRTTCPRGHAYDAIHANGGGSVARTCRRCTAQKQRRYQARMRAAA